MQTLPDRKKLATLLGLALICGIAFVIRYQGIWFGYPLPVHPDEPYLVNTALNMLNSGDLNPHWFFYPTFNIYLQALVYLVTQYFGFIYLAAIADGQPVAGMPIIWLYIAGRSLNLIFSILTIIVTYQIGRILFSSLTGLVAAFFLSFCYLHTVNSYLLTVDTTVAFWSSTAVLMAALIYTREPNTRFYLLGGIFAGLAIGSKYTAFVIVAPLLIAHLAKAHSSSSVGLLDRRIIICLLTIPLTFFLTSPYVLLDFNHFLDAASILSEQYTDGHPGASSESNTSWLEYGKYLFAEGYGLLPMLFAFGGFMLLLVRKAFWKTAIITAFPLLLLILVGRYKVYFPRNIVALTPFLALLSGVFIVYFFTQLRARLASFADPVRNTLACITLLIVLTGSVWGETAKSIAHIKEITLPDTRWISLEWIENNLPGYSRIGREHYTPPIEQHTENFRVRYLGFFGAIKNPEELDKLQYMVVSSGDYDRYLSEPDRYPAEAQAYLAFFETHELLVEFIPEPGRMGGPRISIFKLRQCTAPPCLTESIGDKKSSQSSCGDRDDLLAERQETQLDPTIISSTPLNLAIANSFSGTAAKWIAQLHCRAWRSHSISKASAALSTLVTPLRSICKDS